MKEQYGKYLQKDYYEGIGKLEPLKNNLPGFLPQYNKNV